MIIREYFTCRYTDPKGAGALNHDARARAWEWRCSTPADGQAMNAAWEFTNAEYLEPLNAVVLASRHDRVASSMNPDSWRVQEGTSACWRLVKPPTMPQATYLKYYDCRPDQWGQALIKKVFDLDAGIALYVLQGAPTDQVVSVSGGVASLASITADQGLLQPSVGVLLPPFSYNGKWVGYRIDIPTSSNWIGSPSDPTGKGKEDAKPSLYRMDYGGPTGDTPGTWKKVSEFAGNALQQELKAATTRGTIEELIYLRHLEGFLMIAAGEWGDWWIYKDEVTQKGFSQGQIGVYSVGHQAAFLPCQQTIPKLPYTYTDPDTGEQKTEDRYWGKVSYRSVPLQPPSDKVNLAKWQLQAKGADPTKRDGAAITPFMAVSPEGKDEQGNDRIPKQIDRLGCELRAQNPYRTPILYRLTEIYPADFLIESGETPAIPLQEVVIRREENDKGFVRGSTCELTTVPGLSKVFPWMRGNEWVQVRCSSLDCDGSSSDEYAVFTGRVVNPETILHDTTTDEPITIHLHDDSFRLEKKKCRDRIPDMEGWGWNGAVIFSCEAFGIPRQLIRINGVSYPAIETLPNDFFLPKYDPESNWLPPGPDPTSGTDWSKLLGRIGKDKIRKDTQPDYNTEAIAWLDHLCALRGDWIWRIEPDGYYHFLPRPTASDDTVIFVLQYDPADPDNRLYKVTDRRDQSRFFNEVVVMPGSAKGFKSSPDAPQPEGAAVARDARSQQDPTYRYYIGDVWEEVVESLEGANEAMAKKRLEYHRSVGETVIWEGRGMHIFPGQHVQVDLNGYGLDLPDHSLFRVTGEERRLVANGDEITHRCTYTCHMGYLADPTAPGQDPIG